MRTARRLATATTKIDSEMDRKAFVTLRFAGDDLDPAQVSAILPVTPTRAHRKGEEFWLLLGSGVVGGGLGGVPAGPL
jgi:hypothetical protein